MNKKILLIDDDAVTLKKTAEILELADYKVRCAENGRAGVNLAKSELPDLILCDILMPELDGYGVLAILRKNKVTGNIPFVFISAKNTISDIRKGMNCGADDFLTKPFDETALLEAVRTRIKRKEHLLQDLSQNSITSHSTRMEEGTVEFQLPIEFINKYPTKYFSKKEHIYREFDHANHFFSIKTGKIKILKTDSYGKSLIKGVYVPRTIFGDLSCFNQALYGETAIAMEEGTQVHIIPKKELIHLVRSDNQSAFRFICHLVENILKKESQLLQMAYSPVRERVAATLLTCMRWQTTSVDRVICLSREDLAGMVGTTKESLVRCLSEFKLEKIIESSGSDIKIIDENYLNKLAKGFL